jgi:SAM-dependent methyltransferase
MAGRLPFAKFMPAAPRPLPLALTHSQRQRDWITSEFDGAPSPTAVACVSLPSVMSLEPTSVLDEVLDVRERDVLDAGCGEGWLVRRLSSAGARALGLDPLHVALERARRDDATAPPGRYVQGGAEALPFRDACFDVVVFFNSLHHVPVDSLDVALEEAARVLRPDGVVYVQEPLAQGPFFELVRTVEDETEVRAAAQDALARAAAGRFALRLRRDGVIATWLADFEAFRARMVSVDPARVAALADLETELRADFERLGRRSDGGYVFEQPFRAHLLAP